MPGRKQAARNHPSWIERRQRSSAAARKVLITELFPACAQNALSTSLGEWLGETLCQSYLAPPDKAFASWLNCGVFKFYTCWMKRARKFCVVKGLFVEILAP